MGAADQLLQIGDSAADMLTILGNGYVGIGIANQTAKFEINDTTNVNSGTNFADRLAPFYITNDGGTNGLLMDANALETTNTTLHFNYSSGNDVNIGNGDLYVDNSTGFAGIGNITAATRLEVGANANANEIISVKSQYDAAIELYSDTDNSDETHNPYVLFSQDNTAAQAIIGQVGSAGTNPQNGAFTNTLANALLIGTYDANGAIQLGTNDAVRMTVLTTGEVGIGDVSPTATLTVGDGDLFQVAGASGNITTAGTLAVNGDSITADGATLTINAGGNVDVQDALNADNITTDTGGVSIAAGQSYTGLVQSL